MGKQKVRHKEFALPCCRRTVCGNTSGLDPKVGDTGECVYCHRKFTVSDEWLWEEDAKDE